MRAFERVRLDVEGRVDHHVVADLERRGHEVRVLEPFTWAVGGGHGIRVDTQTGALQGGADPRRDGAVDRLMATGELQPQLHGAGWRGQRELGAGQRIQPDVRDPDVGSGPGPHGQHARRRVMISTSSSQV